MTNQQPPFTVEELMAASAKSYGLVIGTLTTENLLLKKQVATLEAALDAAGVKISEDKQERDRLVANAITYEDRIYILEEELEARPTPEDITAFEVAIQELEATIKRMIIDGPTLAQTAELEISKTADRNEKAARTEAA